MERLTLAAMRSSAVLGTILCLLLCSAATDTNTSINIMPRNLTVREGESATFTCELPCTHAAYWYVGDLYNSVPLPYVDTVPGLTYTRTITPAGGCDVGTYVDSITIEAMVDLDRVAVQCAASPIECPIDETCSVVYSRFRTLRVERLPETTPTPSPSPSPPPQSDTTTSSSSTSSSESVVCPTPSPVVVTSIETVVTTQTSIVVTTVTVTAPNIDDPGSRGSAGSGLLKGVGLTSAVVVSSIVVILTVLLRL